MPYRKDPAARKAMLAISRPKQQRKQRNGAIEWDEDPVKLHGLTIERFVARVIHKYGQTVLG